MAAITTLQVESITSADNELQWIDPNPAQAPVVHRSTDNFVGSDVTLATLVAGVKVYSDLTPVTGTRYWYKVHQTAGDSNVVNVVTQVCFVLGSQPQPGVTMPQMSDPMTADQVNQLIDQLNQTLGGTNDPTTPCTVCSTHGALILDCTACNSFAVQMSEDINSISMIGCTGGGGTGGPAPGPITITFTVPPNGTFNVSGFPKGSGADPGNTVLGGGAAGTNYKVDCVKTPALCVTNPGTGAGTGGGGGGGGGGSLKLTCQTPTGGANASCSIACGTLKKVRMVASGGVLPYAYSVTGGLTQSAIAFDTTDLTPPANTGSGVAGNAYTAMYENCVAGFRQRLETEYGCGDTVTVACGVTNLCTGSGDPCSNGTSCDGFPKCIGPAPVGCSGYPSPNSSNGNCCPGGTDTLSGAQKVCDTRTGGMIAANCNPCGVSSAGKIFTVTDGTGTSVTKTITI